MGTNRIYSRAKLARVVSFEGLPHIGPCSPTDIDFCIEVGAQKKYLVGDLKESGKDLSHGQRLLIERTVNAFKLYGYESVGFLAWHPVGEDPIDAKSALVVRYYANGSWRDVQQDLQTLGNRYARFFNLGTDPLGEIWRGVSPQ